MEKYNREAPNESHMILVGERANGGWGRQPSSFILQSLWMNQKGKEVSGEKKKKQGQQRNEPQVSGSESCSETHLQRGEIGCLQANTVFGIANFFRGKLNQKHLCLLPDALSCYFVSKFLISWGNEEYSKQLIMEHECGSSQEIISLQEIERGKKSTQLAKKW